jgi:hypothetical protein
MPQSLASRAAAESLRDVRPSFERLRALLPVEDLSASAVADGEPALHEAFGCDSLEELARGLHRQRKGQVLLTGDRGVGRTTLVRRLAAAAAQGRFPGLAHRRFVRLDVANVGPEDSRACLETIFARRTDKRLEHLPDKFGIHSWLSGNPTMMDITHEFSAAAKSSDSWTHSNVRTALNALCNGIPGSTSDWEEDDECWGRVLIKDESVVYVNANFPLIIVKLPFALAGTQCAKQFGMRIIIVDDFDSRQFAIDRAVLESLLGRELSTNVSYESISIIELWWSTI